MSVVKSHPVSASELPKSVGKRHYGIIRLIIVS